MGYGPPTVCQTSSMERLSSFETGFGVLIVGPPSLADGLQGVKLSELSCTGGVLGGATANLRACGGRPAAVVRCRNRPALRRLRRRGAGGSRERLSRDDARRRGLWQGYNWPLSRRGEKQELTRCGETVGPRDSRVRQGFVFDMVPPNRIQQAIPDLKGQPTTARWNSLQLEQLKALLLSGSSRRCPFYLF